MSGSTRPSVADQRAFCRAQLVEDMPRESGVIRKVSLHLPTIVGQHVNLVVLPLLLTKGLYVVPN
jgi:hypothetical protein